MTPRTETLSTQLLLGRARQKQLKLLSVFLFLLLVLGFFGVVLGPASIQWRALFDTVSGVTSHSVDHTVIFQLRMPRVLLAIVAGGALACSGAALQSLFNNPLAEPGLIGISSGAMIFVILGILLMPLLPVLGPVLSEHYIWTLPVLGFVGAMGLGVLVYRLSSLNGRVDVTTMLLAGIAANAFAGAIAGLLIFVSNDEQLRTITFWTMGSLGGATWGMVIPVVALVAFGVCSLIRLSSDMECLALGEKEACLMGVDVDRVKKVVFFTAALAAGTTVAMTGIIGFVGLVVPHILRSSVRLNMRSFMIACFFVGGSFLVGADVLSRTLIAPTEIPIGILTSLVGTPYFVYLLRQRRGRTYA